MHLGKQVNVGGTYRTGQDVPLHGDLSALDSRFPLTVPGIGTLTNEASDFTQTVRNPTTYGNRPGLASGVLGDTGK